MVADVSYVVNEGIGEVLHVLLTQIPGEVLEDLKAPFGFQDMPLELAHILFVTGTNGRPDTP